MSAGDTLYVLQHRDVSGAERMHAELIRADPGALVACPPGSPAERFARELGAEIAPLGFRSLRHSAGAAETARSALRGLAGAYELRKLLRRHRERRIVFCTNLRGSMVASLAATGLGRRLLWCLPDLLPPGPLDRLVRALAASRADRVLCLSDAVATDLVRGSPGLARVARVVHPGVDPGRFDGAAPAPGAPLAAIVGHVSPLKRTEMAVDVAALVARRVPNFRLRIVGRAQFRDEDFALERSLRERVATDPALRDVVELHGFAAEVGAALRGVGLLLHCRPDEPFGIALIEAMALGIPVVAPASAGPLEIVVDGETGLLYPPGDVAVAAELVERLCADRALARRLGAAARRRVEAEFSLDRQLAETRALLAELEP